MDKTWARQTQQTDRTGGEKDTTYRRQDKTKEDRDRADPDKAKWYLYDLGNADSLINQRLLFDASSYITPTSKGLPDGLKADGGGNIFATGPGGVYIFNASGKLLGRMLIPEACSNVALAEEGKVLFITADMYVLRVKLR